MKPCPTCHQPISGPLALHNCPTGPTPTTISNYGHRLRSMATHPTRPSPAASPSRPSSRLTCTGRIDREEETALNVAFGARAVTILGIATPYLLADLLNTQSPSLTGPVTALVAPLAIPLLLLVLLAFLTRRPWWLLRSTARTSWAIGSRINNRPDRAGRALLVRSTNRTQRVHLARDIAAPVGSTIHILGPSIAGITRAWFYRVDGIDTRTRTCRGVPLAAAALLYAVLASGATLLNALT